MNNSIIISSQSTDYYYNKINEIKAKYKIDENSKADYLEIRVQNKKSSIGIDQMKSLIVWSKIKPYNSKGKLACIFSAELLTIEAQNSILKILEEPNKNNTYVLLTNNFTNLLPTILSRCELIFDNTEYIKEIDINDFIKMDLIDRFKYVQKIYDIKDSKEKSNSIIKLFYSLLKFFQKKLYIAVKQQNEQDIKTHSFNIDLINQCNSMIKSNVPAKTVLNYMILNVNIDEKML